MVWFLGSTPLNLVNEVLNLMNEVLNLVKGIDNLVNEVLDLENEVAQLVKTAKNRVELAPDIPSLTSTDKSVCRENGRRKEAPFCKPSRYDGFDEESTGAKGTERCKQRVSGRANFRSNTRPSR